MQYPYLDKATTQVTTWLKQIGVDDSEIPGLLLSLTSSYTKAHNKAVWYIGLFARYSSTGKRILRLRGRI